MFLSRRLPHLESKRGSALKRKKLGVKRCFFQDVCHISHQREEAPFKKQRGSLLELSLLALQLYPLEYTLARSRARAHTHTHVYSHVHMCISEEREGKRENFCVNMYISEQNEQKTKRARATLTISALSSCSYLNCLAQLS